MFQAGPFPAGKQGAICLTSAFWWKLLIFFDVRIPELIHGERKSETMIEEAKETAEAMSIYANTEKGQVLKRARIISIVGLAALIIGLAMLSWKADSGIPVFEVFKGSCLGLAAGALVTMVLFAAGILEKNQSQIQQADEDCFCSLRPCLDHLPAGGSGALPLKRPA